MKIGILGGTFDPIHQGHIALALAARQQLKLSVVYLMPSPRSPFKTKAPLTPIKHRLSMVAKAIQGHSSLRVGRFELNRKGPSYTVQTLLALQKKRPGDPFTLILGSDAWSGFHHWKRPQKILELAHIAIGRRPRAKLAALSASLHSRATVLKGVFPDISSTQIRQQLHQIKKNKKNLKLESWLSRSVLNYIRRHHLYEL